MRSWRTVAVTLVGPMALALVCGCGGQGGPPRGKTSKVSGTITWQGKPVPYGSVTFVPDRSKGNKGRAGTGSIKDGKYVVKTYKQEEGALVGWHRVELSYPKAKPGTETDTKMEPVDQGDNLPDIYRGDKSVLSAKVEEGKDNTINFDLPRAEDKMADDGEDEE